MNEVQPRTCSPYDSTPVKSLDDKFSNKFEFILEVIDAINKHELNKRELKNKINKLDSFITKNIENVSTDDELKKFNMIKDCRDNFEETVKESLSKRLSDISVVVHNRSSLETLAVSFEKEEIFFPDNLLNVHEVDLTTCTEKVVVYASKKKYPILVVLAGAVGLIGLALQITFKLSEGEDRGFSFSN